MKELCPYCAYCDRGWDFNPEGRDADSTWYYLTDSQFSVRQVVDEFGALYERLDYTPYGEPRHSFAADINRVGGVNAADFATYPSGTYNPDWDFNADGITDSADIGVYAAQNAHGPLPDGWISEVRSSATEYGPDNSIGYAGYVNNAEISMYTVRFRILDPATARWMTRDPIGYAGGQNLYGYVGGMPVRFIDPLGLGPNDRTSGGSSGGGYDPRNDPNKGCGITYNKRNKTTGHAWLEIDDPANDTFTRNGTRMPRPDGYGFWPEDLSGNYWGLDEPGITLGPHHNDPDLLEFNTGKDIDEDGITRSVTGVRPFFHPARDGVRGLYGQDIEVVRYPPMYGILPDGTRTDSADCDKIRDCVRKRMIELGENDWSLRYNCRSAAKEALYDCGLDLDD